MDNQNFNQQVPNQPLPENPQTPPIMPEAKSKKNIWIVSGIFGAVVVIILASFFYLNKGKQQTPTPIDTEQPISIKSAISTEFAEYKPYTVDITPNTDSYSLPVNLGKIENKKKFNLDNEAEKKLTEQGFVAVSSNYNQIYSIYEDNTENARPNFVTTDSVLHTYHILYDYTLRNLEINKFIPDLKNLNKVLLQNALSQYSSVSDPSLKSAAKKNVAYFTVASKLLEPETGIPTEVQDLVEQELSLIDKHSGFQVSPIFGYKEDYSQYVPRGHYTRNEDFKKYFKANPIPNATKVELVIK